MKEKWSSLLIALFVISLSACSFSNGESSLSSKVEESSITNPLPDIDISNPFEVKLNFDTSAANENEISPFIYGSSFENLGTTTYNGIYAEIIRDRKFHLGVNEKESHWETIQGSCSYETINNFQGDKSIKLSAGSCLYQDNLSLDKKAYDFYFYVKGSGEVTVTFTLNKHIYTHTFNITSSNEYKKYEFSFESEFKATKYSLTVDNKESIVVDCFSLLPSDNYYGMRLDTLNELKDMKVPLLRWPGGDFVSGYDFYDGIGDKDLRPTKINQAWIANGSTGNSYFIYDPNDFGLEEFLMMCDYVGAEPNVVINSGLGSKQMALDELEFCNGLSSSTFGSKRMYQVKSYGVTYFSIGNEMYGTHELGHTTSDEYVIRHNEFVNAMRNVDPNLKFIASGNSRSAWSQDLIDGCEGNIDLLSQHFYADRYEDDVKRHILSISNLSAASLIRNHNNLNNIGDITLSFDEYGYSNVVSESRLKDGMGVASALNTFIEESDTVKIACFSETVNSTQGTVITDNFKAYREANGYVLSMYRHYAQNHYLPITYKGSFDYFYQMGATINNKKDEITLSVINSDEDKVLKINCDHFKELKSMIYLTGDDYNSVNNDKGIGLHLYEGQIEGDDLYIPCKSVALITIGI